MEPVLKWAGGKRQILKKLQELMPKEMLSGHTYYEPFVGGGSVFMALAHSEAVINDSNPELVNVYLQIRDNPEEVIFELKEHAQVHSKEHFYEVRAWDRTEDYSKRSAVEKAVRTIYLNRTCFNGLYRVNAQGFFNVPIGSYKNPQIVREEQIREISKYLKTSDVTILCGDFAEAVRNAKRGDVVYFDPPYDYDDVAEGFDRYTVTKFHHDDLKRLGEICEELVCRGCHVIISNNDTSFVNEVFSHDRFEFIQIQGRRMINNTSEKRHGVDEVIILGK